MGGRGGAGEGGSGGSGADAGASGAGDTAGQGGTGDCSTEPPSCVDASTARSCATGRWTDVTCEGGTPVCVDGLGCQPCTEHADCPDSACHLGGPKQGTCFSEASVVNVKTAAELAAAFAALEDGDEKVFRLTQTIVFDDDTAAAEIHATAEIALVGKPGVMITGGPSFGDPRASVLGISPGGDGALTYLAGLEFQGTSTSSAINLAGGKAWLDDVRVRGYARALGENAETHIRRSAFAGSAYGVYVAGGSIFMQNSAIGPNGEGVDGLMLGASVTVDLRYVTIAGNTNGINCLPAGGPASGVVRNSVLTSVTGNSIYGGTDGSYCSTIQMQNVAVDQAGYDALIGWYNAAWFADPENGDFHLTASGKAAIPKIAELGEDDPGVDIDGQPRKSKNGYPGIDEP